MYIDGTFNPEQWANSIGDVVASGVDGINVGDKVGLLYQAIFDYIWVGETRVHKNMLRMDDGSIYWLIDKSVVLCIIDGNDYKAFGEWSLLRPIEAKVTHSLLIGVPQVMAKGKYVKGEGRLVSSGEPIKGCEAGDVVMFEEKFRNTYEFGYKNEFIVLRSNILMAKKGGVHA